MRQDTVSNRQTKPFLLLVQYFFSLCLTEEKKEMGKNRKSVCIDVGLQHQTQPVQHEQVPFNTSSLASIH